MTMEEDIKEIKQILIDHIVPVKCGHCGGSGQHAWTNVFSGHECMNTCDSCKGTGKVKPI